MYCEHCGTKIGIEDIFCGGCGNSLKKNTGEIFKLKEEGISSNEICEVCLKKARVKYVEFYENRGALFMRYHREIKGKLCKNCINKYFWKFTLTTIAIGWLGTISFIITPFYILNNIGRYVWSKIK